jgi:shikimate dehydrogenase
MNLNGGPDMKETGVTGKTRVCGIIGDPVEHTLSPVMHNAAFHQMNLDFIYLPFRVRREDLEGALEGMIALNIRGLNVTLPHKIAVMPLLEEIDDLARRIGAVNTIVNDAGTLKGYNTDASGFRQALAAGNINLTGKNVLVLGAGGAARSIAFVLADRGARITLLNRSPGPARALAEWLTFTFRREVEAVDLNVQNLEAALEKADALVNTTSVGMVPEQNATLVPQQMLHKGLSVIDIVYNPVKTRLLREAESAGSRTLSGLDMLVRQGAAAFELWVGEKAPVEEMRRAAAKVLIKA